MSDASAHPEAKFQIRLTRAERFALKSFAAQRQTTMEAVVVGLIRRELNGDLDLAVALDELEASPSQRPTIPSAPPTREG